MDEMIGFLWACLAEDEDAALEMLAGTREWTAEGRDVRSGDHALAEASWDRPAAHIARHDPARVLREVAAKRHVIDQVLQYEASADAERGCCHSAGEIAAGSCPEARPTRIEAFRHLATAWNDRPGYRDAWKP